MKYKYCSFFTTSCFIIINFFLLQPAYSHNINIGDSLNAIAQYNKALNLFDLGNFETALNEFEKSSDNFKKLEFKERYFESENKINQCYWRIGKYEISKNRSKNLIIESINVFGENNIYEALGYNSLATIHSISGFLDSASFYCNKALKIFNSIPENSQNSLGIAYNLKGIIYYQKSDIDSATFFLNKSLEIKIKINGKDNLSVAKSYNNIGAMYLANGELSKAKDYFLKALAIHLKNRFNDYLSMHNIYKNMGSIYYDQGNYEKAISEYSTAYKYLKKSTINESHYRVIEVLQNIGNCFNMISRTDSALIYCRKAVKIAIDNYGSENRFLGRAYNNLGNAFLKAKNYDSADYYLNKSLYINKKFLNKLNSEVLLNYYNLANLSFAKAQYKKAIQMANFGISINLFIQPTLNLFQSIPQIDRYLDFMHLWSTLYLKGKAAERLFYKSNDIRFLNVSKESYELAINLIDSVKNRETSENEIIRLIRNSKPVFSGAMRVNKIIYEKENKIGLAEKLFEIAQKYRTTSLSSTATKLTARNVIGIPDSFYFKEKELKERYSNLFSSLVNQMNKPLIDTTKTLELQNKIFLVKQELEMFENNLQYNFPKYYDLKYSNHIVNSEQVLREVDSEKMIIEYYVGDSSIFSFAMHKDSLGFKIINRKKVESNYLMLNKSIDSQYHESNSLYTDIVNIWNIPSSVRYITFIPDDFLWNLNFDLLVTDSTNCQIRKNCSYLLHRYNISYSYSSFFLTQHLKNKWEINSKLIAFSFSERMEDSYRGNISLKTLRNSNELLPGSSKEISAISELVDGDYYYGINASESTFKTYAKDYNLIHLAIHGETNDKQPEMSKLIFYNKGDSIEDGNLFAFEIYNMSLNCKLVVLSACKTGSGKLESGEGLMSLGRAFSYAGTQSLLLSRWEASDVTTPVIMKYFYEGLTKGLRKSEALNYAKKKFLKLDSDNITSDPFYWAGFYILGDDQPIIKKVSWDNYLWIGLFFSLLFLSGLFLYRKAQ